MADRDIRTAEERRRGDRREDVATNDDRKSASVRQAIRTELAGDERARRKPPRGPNAPPVVQVDHVSLAFDVPILEDISFSAPEGETIAIVGESGTGKSTVLKLILRLLIPDRGRVLIDGEDITNLTFEEALKVRQKMGMVFQGAALFDSMTVFENVAYPLRAHTDLVVLMEEIGRAVMPVTARVGFSYSRPGLGQVDENDCAGRRHPPAEDARTGVRLDECSRMLLDADQLGDAVECVRGDGLFRRRNIIARRARANGKCFHARAGKVSSARCGIFPAR